MPPSSCSCLYHRNAAVRSPQSPSGVPNAPTQGGLYTSLYTCLYTWPYTYRTQPCTHARTSCVASPYVLCVESATSVMTRLLVVLWRPRRRQVQFPVTFSVEKMHVVVDMLREQRKKGPEACKSGALLCVAVLPPNIVQRPHQVRCVRWWLGPIASIGNRWVPRPIGVHICRKKKQSAQPR